MRNDEELFERIIHSVNSAEGTFEWCCGYMDIGFLFLDEFKQFNTQWRVSLQTVVIIPAD